MSDEIRNWPATVNNSTMGEKFITYMRQIEYLQPRLFRVDIGSYGTILYKLSDGVFDLICTQFLLSSFNW